MSPREINRGRKVKKSICDVRSLALPLILFTDPFSLLNNMLIYINNRFALENNQADKIIEVEL